MDDDGISKDEVLEGVTRADVLAAVDELGPADGSNAQGDRIVARAFEIALERRLAEAGGGPVRFLGHVIMRKQ
jgi:hypothetical protein